MGKIAPPEENIVTPAAPKKKFPLLPVGIAIAVIIIVELIWAQYYLKGKSAKTKAPITNTNTRTGLPSPLPTPQPKRLAQGRQEFTVSSKDATKGPQFSTIVVDPYDPRVGASQTMSITVSDKVPVTTVTVTVATDTEKKTYPLKLSSGEGTNGVWEGTWKSEDTHETSYTATFTAKDGRNTDTVTLTIR